MFTVLLIHAFLSSQNYKFYYHRKRHFVEILCTKFQRYLVFIYFTRGWTTGWMFVYTMQLVVQPVVQPVWQPVVSSKRGLKLIMMVCPLWPAAISFFLNFLLSFCGIAYFMSRNETYVYWNMASELTSLEREKTKPVENWGTNLFYHSFLIFASK